MTDTTTIERDPKIEEARARLQQVATKLCTRIDPLDVGGSYLAIGTALVTGVMGKAGAGRYLRELAAELDGDNDPGWGGSA